ncbi:asparagine synthase C-terminal domain-containing protein [Zobellia galactanivorans]|uniref:asparagine synthase (glutamine-hydrolyzing) n=1 Tax=Zobellia galactanivorans (strain DSM 12802 / CCUG 47099 / CIP 106680 / NCIMB 13871 / Dsij) TaxID=63186 RepID=G0L4W0_ZOBGA|nr:asparagine synthase C-terminal domain-containing protein [Zobellia galactanivorans]CAZ95796.1 Conserved hypothetical protein [Zobellia galactanivorans]
MSLKIDLVYNLTYEWQTSARGNVHVKGYVFTKEGRLLRGIDFLNYCSEVTDENSLREKIFSCTGTYTIILHVGDDLFIVTDAVRTFPVFYTQEENTFHVSDSCEVLKKKYGSGIDTRAEGEFLGFGYCIREKTLLKNVFQVQAGEFLKYSVSDKKLEKTFYTDYLTKEVFLAPTFSELQSTLVNILEKLVDRMMLYIGKKQVVLPLSGGYDSRLIACLLKSRGVENVICFTYGAQYSPEVLISKKVAKELGYKWHFIEYTQEVIPKDYTSSLAFERYHSYAANYSSVFLLQDFFAIKELKEKNIISEDSIIIPGHSGDFLAGSHLSKFDENNKDRSKTIERIFAKHCILDRKTKLTPSHLNYIKNVDCNYEYAVDDNWGLKERQAKFIVNSVRVYEYFGFEHYLPLWDRSLEEFFKSVPVNYKINTVLYNQTIFEKYFNLFNVSFYKVEKNKTSLKTKAKNILRRLVPAEAVGVLKEVRRKDINRTNLVKRPLLLEMKKEDRSSDKINSVISAWYINKIKTID